MKINTNIFAYQFGFIHPQECWEWMVKDARYKEMIIPKKNGKIRVVHEPDEIMKSVHAYLKTMLQHTYMIALSQMHHPAIHPPLTNEGKSVFQLPVTEHAARFVKKKYICKFDIHHFYPSVSREIIFTMLTSSPYHVDKETAALVSMACTHKNQMVQGASTSPVLGDMLFLMNDLYFFEHYFYRGIIYGRYVDDIIFASDEPLPFEEIKRDLIQKLHPLGLKIHEKKTGSFGPQHRRTVTGITINEKLNVSRNYIRHLRAILHDWKQHGIDNATASHFHLLLPEVNEHVKSNFIKRVQGLVSWVGQVRGQNDAIYLRMKNQYKELRDIK